MIHRSLIAVFIVSLFGSVPVGAAGGRLYLDPPSGGVGSGLSVRIRINTGGEEVNAVKAVVIYPANLLAFSRIDGAGSAFGLEVSNKNTPGRVEINRGVLGNVVG